MTNNTFKKWIPRYINNLKTKNYSERTIESYEWTITQFAKFKSGGNGLDCDIETTSADIDDFMSSMRSERDLSAATVHQYDSALSSFYKFLMKQDVVYVNPMDKVDRPKIKEREIKYLKREEVIKFIRKLKNPRDKLIVRMIFTTGMRISELVNLKIEDIHFEDGTIRVLGKGGKIRTVFIDKSTLNLIKKHMNGREEGYIFEGYKGGHLSKEHIEREVFKKYAPAGITPHKIRHSYATELYRNSHDLQLVKDTLGHSSIKTTEIYMHADLEEQKEAYRRSFKPL